MGLKRKSNKVFENEPDILKKQNKDQKTSKNLNDVDSEESILTDEIT